MQTNFDAVDLAAVRKPCVYKYLDENAQPLYIGQSEHGYSRVFERGSPSKNKWHKNRWDASHKATSLEIVFFETVEEAKQTEKTLIHQLHPKYNRCYTCWVKDGEKLSDIRHGVRIKYTGHS